MKIQTIHINNNKTKTNISKNIHPKRIEFKKDTVEFSCAKQVSFKGFEEIKLKAQKKLLETQATKMYKAASEIKNDSWEILKNAQEQRLRAVSILEDAKDVFLDAQEEFKKGALSNYSRTYDCKTGEIIKEFYDGINDQLIMEEYDEKGETKKKIIKDNQITMVILQDKNPKKQNAYIFDTETGELIQFLKDTKIYSDGYKAQEQFAFKDNRLETYDLKHEIVMDEYEKSYEHYVYNGKDLRQYNAEWSYTQGGIEKSSEHIIFKDGQIKRASLGVVDDFDSTRTTQEDYCFEDGDITICAIDTQQPQNLSYINIKTMFKFNDMGAQTACIDYKANSKDKTTTAQKIFHFTDDKITRCLIDYQRTRDGNETFSKNIKL